jgi:hypothetical protein
LWLRCNSAACASARPRFPRHSAGNVRDRPLMAATKPTMLDHTQDGESRSFEPFRLTSARYLRRICAPIWRPCAMPTTDARKRAAFNRRRPCELIDLQVEILRYHLPGEDGAVEPARCDHTFSQMGCQMARAFHSPFGIVARGVMMWCSVARRRQSSPSR